jgi:hypothetical protein
VHLDLQEICQWSSSTLGHPICSTQDIVQAIGLYRPPLEFARAVKELPAALAAQSKGSGESSEKLNLLSQVVVVFGPSGPPGFGIEENIASDKFE